MLLLPPIRVPKTRAVVSEHLGLSESKQPDVWPRHSARPASGLEGRLLPAAVNLVHLDRAKLHDKAGSKFPSVTLGQISWSRIPESAWSSNKKMAPEVRSGGAHL